MQITNQNQSFLNYLYIFSQISDFTDYRFKMLEPLKPIVVPFKAQQT